MTINQLRYFCETYRQNSICKAAQILFVSQPAISAAIRDLEKEYQVKLFVRNNNRLHVTEAGTLLYEHSQTLLQQADCISEIFRNELVKSRKISIGMMPDLANWVIPYLKKPLGELRSKYSNLEIALIEMSYADIDRVIMNHDIDLAFFGTEDSFHLNPNIGVKPIYRTIMKVCMNRKHPLAKEKVITPQMLQAEEIIGNYYDQVTFQNWLDGVFSGCKDSPRMRYFFLELNTVATLLEMNQGVCLARPEINGMRMDKLVAIPLEGPCYSIISILYDNRVQLRQEVVDLMDLLHPLPEQKLPTI